MQEQLPDACEFGESTGMCLAEPEGPTRTPRSGARSSGILSLAYFSLDKHCAAGAARTPKAARRAQGRMPGVKRSRSAPAEGDETWRQRRRRRVKPRARAKERRAARSTWIPAFAGMTSGGALAGITSGGALAGMTSGGAFAGMERWRDDDRKKRNARVEKGVARPRKRTRRLAAPCDHTRRKTFSWPVRVPSPRPSPASSCRGWRGTRCPRTSSASARRRRARGRPGTAPAGPASRH
jgi:hypothetical protein